MEDRDWRDCRQCLSGDNDACTALFKRHEAEVARQMWRFTRNRAACEELVQEVFVEAYLSLKRYRRLQVPFVHWLRRIATRVGYRYWKQQARRRKHVPLEGFDAPICVSEVRDPSVAAAILHDLLARLPAADRLVLTLKYFEECGIEQIAQRTGWNQAMVKMRAFRARRRLKKIIEREKLFDALQDVIHETA